MSHSRKTGQCYNLSARRRCRSSGRHPTKLRIRGPIRRRREPRVGSPYLTGVPPIRLLRPARPDPARRPYGALAAAPFLATVRDRLRRATLPAGRRGWWPCGPGGSGSAGWRIRRRSWRRVSWCGYALRLSRSSAPSSAPDLDDVAVMPRVRVVHPFHPWSGREFEFVQRRRTWDVDRVLFWSPGIFVDISIMLLLVPDCQIAARNPLGLSCRADVVSGRDCNIARCSRTRRS